MRTADKLIIFSGYAGGSTDGGDAGSDNVVYVQAFDAATATPLGAAVPLSDAPDGDGFVVESASVAPTGEIALGFNYGGSFPYQTGSKTQTSLYAAFLGPDADGGPAGLTHRETVELESGTVMGQPHVIWSVPTGSFVLSCGNLRMLEPRGSGRETT